MVNNDERPGVAMRVRENGDGFVATFGPRGEVGNINVLLGGMGDASLVGRSGNMSNKPDRAMAPPDRQTPSPKGGSM